MGRRRSAPAAAVRSNPLTAAAAAASALGAAARSRSSFRDAIFALPDEQIARFLSVLYACDGHVYTSRALTARSATRRSARVSRPMFSTCCCDSASSPAIRDAATCRLRGHADGRAGGADHEPARVSTRLRRASRWSARRPAGRAWPSSGAQLGAEGRTPTRCRRRSGTGSWSAKGERPWGAISAATGRVAEPQLARRHRRGVSRAAAAAELASATAPRNCAVLATSDLWWDEVASIEPLGEQETYDLTVPGDHNFVANDIVVHNSALMANFCENAALEGKKAVALFSLEMSESELAQRFIASQASIKGDDLRKGNVPEVALAEDHAGERAAGRLAAVHRRLVGPLGARRAREGAPARPAARRRARPDRHRLPAADAGRRQRREPRRADLADLPRAQDARARARGARDRALAAQPRRRAAHGQAPGALGPARVRRDRAGRRPRDVHLPRRVLRPRVRARGDRGPDHLQAPQRRPRDGRADVPEGVPALHVLRAARTATDGARALPRRPLRRLRASSTTRQARRARPCSCRPQRLARKQGRGRPGRLPQALPRGLLRPRAGAVDRPPRAGRRARRSALRPARSPSSSPRAAGCGSRGSVGTGKTTLAMLDLQGRDGGRPHGRDLLAAAAAGDAARHLRRRRRVLAQRPDRPAVRGGPAARRRRRRRADSPVGARAALHDRQHPLRGRPGGGAHHEPARRRAAGADRRPHRLAPERDVRRRCCCTARTSARAATSSCPSPRRRPPARAAAGGATPTARGRTRTPTSRPPTGARGRTA